MIPAAQRMEKFSVHFFASLEAKIRHMQAEGCDVIRLDIGSPDLPPPHPIIEALYRSACEPDHHGYQPHASQPGLRLAWAAHYRQVFGVELDPEREIIPLLGSKEGIVHFPLAFINPGDVVLVPDPGYITYTRGALLAGGEPYFIPLLPENDYLPSLERIPSSILRRARLLWLNYPNNPTSATATIEFFTQAVEFAQRHGLMLCHDAAYAQIVFDGYRAPSLLEVPGAKEVAVEFNTLSKSHNMPGWRVGVLVGNARAVGLFFALKTNLDSGHFRPVTDAAQAALSGNQDWLKERNAVYQLRRDRVLKTLRCIGLEPRTPQASLYIWCPVPSGQTSIEFAENLLERAQVSLAPGEVFGEHGQGFVRIALTSPTERIEEAMQRLERNLG